jgi:hypothetical protein
MPAIAKEAIKYVYLKWRGAKTVEVQALPTGTPPEPYVFGSWAMTKPYRQPRGVDGEKLQALTDSVAFSELKDFVEDNAKDLTKYGLDPAEGEIILKDETSVLHILVGRNVDDYTTYFRYPTSRNVYTIERARVDSLRSAAFTLADKFAFIVNIDWVDRILIQHRDGRTYTVDLKRDGKDESGNFKYTFSLNGKVIADDLFRKFYQAAIGVLVDGEAEREKSGTPIATFTFILNGDQAEKRKAQTVKMEFLDYDNSFYLVRRDGVGDFVTAKGRDVEKVFADADTLLK